MSPQPLHAMALPVALAGGSWVMLAFIFILLAGVIYGYFTVGGSGIAQHPHGKIYSGAPGAHSPSEASGRDSGRRISDYSRGTR